MLLRVFNHVYSPGRNCTRPVSRALQPYFERNLYRIVSILTGFRTFRKLCKAIAPRLAKHIQKLTLIEGPFSTPSTFEMADEKYVFRFFRAATALESIWLLFGPLLRLESRILSAKYAAHCFGSLKSLSLSTSTAASQPTFFRDAKYLG